MADEPRISIDAAKLHFVDEATAIREFDEFLGTSADWKSGLLQYRVNSDWQKDWRIEVGNWLARAGALGFKGKLIDLVQPLRETVTTGGANDPVHLAVVQRLAQAMAVHYFVGSGWTFDAWEPNIAAPRASGKPADVDVILRAPSGTNVAFQVKASDRPGEIVNGRIVDGEHDDHVRTAIAKAAGQLPSPAVGPAIVLMSAQRTRGLAGDPMVVEPIALGSPVGEAGVVSLRRERFGAFASDWRHVSGIVLLDYRRGLDVFDYACTVLLNPWATFPADTGWFPHGRVLRLDGSRFTWDRGKPAATNFPIGTVLAP